MSDYSSIKISDYNTQHDMKWHTLPDSSVGIIAYYNNTETIPHKVQKYFLMFVLHFAVHF